MPETRIATLKFLTVTVAAGAFLAAVGGCAALRENRPAWPIKEYEKIIAGRLDADYVGNPASTAKCHAHDALARDFRLSVHGEQVAAGPNAPLVNCESCHGPGSLAIEGAASDCQVEKGVRCYRGKLFEFVSPHGS